MPNSRRRLVATALVAVLLTMVGLLVWNRSDTGPGLDAGLELGTPQDPDAEAPSSGAAPTDTGARSLVADGGEARETEPQGPWTSRGWALWGARGTLATDLEFRVEGPMGPVPVRVDGGGRLELAGEPSTPGRCQGDGFVGELRADEILTDRLVAWLWPTATVELRVTSDGPRGFEGVRARVVAVGETDQRGAAPTLWDETVDLDAEGRATLAGFPPEASARVRLVGPDGDVELLEGVPRREGERAVLELRSTRPTPLTLRFFGEHDVLPVEGVELRIGGQEIGTSRSDGTLSVPGNLYELGPRDALVDVEAHVGGAAYPSLARVRTLGNGPGPNPIEQAVTRAMPAQVEVRGFDLATLEVQVRPYRSDRYAFGVLQDVRHTGAGPDGVREVRLPRGATCAVEAWDALGRYAEQVIESPEGGEWIVLEPPDAGSLRLHVRSEGRPLADARVLVDRTWIGRRTLRVDDSGGLVLSRAEEVRTLWITAPGHATVEVSRVRGDDPSGDLTVELERAHRVPVRLRVGDALGAKMAVIVPGGHERPTGHPCWVQRALGARADLPADGSVIELELAEGPRVLLAYPLADSRKQLGNVEPVPVRIAVPHSGPAVELEPVVLRHLDLVVTSGDPSGPLLGFQIDGGGRRLTSTSPSLGRWMGRVPPSVEELEVSAPRHFPARIRLADRPPSGPWHLTLERADPAPWRIEHADGRPFVGRLTVQALAATASGEPGPQLDLLTLEVEDGTVDLGLPFEAGTVLRFQAGPRSGGHKPVEPETVTCPVRETGVLRVVE